MSLIYLQTLILAFIQGVSEFIPVSSSAHLIIFSNIINNQSSSILMDTSLHLGSLIAIVHFFWRDLIDFRNNQKILILLFVGSLPLIIIGYIFYKSDFYVSIRHIEIIAWSTLLFGILLYLSDKKYNYNRFFSDISFDPRR